MLFVIVRDNFLSGSMSQTRLSEGEVLDITECFLQVQTYSETCVHCSGGVQLNHSSRGVHFPQF